MKFPAIKHQPYEAFCMRLGLGLLILGCGLPEVDHLPGQSTPVGMARWLDLTFLSHPPTALVLKALLAIALLLYSFGKFLPLVLPYVLFITIAFGTLHNSQGAIGHSYQPLGLVLLVQAILLIVHYLRGNRKSPGLDPAYYDREIDWTKQAIAAVYLTTAITKLIESQGGWLMDLPNIAVDLQKNQEQFFFDNLTPLKTNLTRLVIDHPNLSYFLFGPAIFLELFAFFALFGRRWALLIGIALVGMHLIIAAVMGLFFKVLTGLVIIYFVNVPYWLVRAWQKIAPPRASDPLPVGQQV